MEHYRSKVDMGSGEEITFWPNNRFPRTVPRAAAEPEVRLHNGVKQNE